MAVDFSNPCERYAALRDAYYQLISGANESLIRYKGPEGEREVRFGPGKIEALKTEMDAAENACAVTTGAADPNRRYAIRAGARRPRGYDAWTAPPWFYVS